MRIDKPTFGVFLVLFLLAAPACAQVSGWRGDGSGVYPNATPPTEWGDKKNILWSTRVGSSYGCPIVVGDRIFLTDEPDKLVCIDRATGKVLWTAANGYDQLPPTTQPDERELPASQCGYGTPTPVSDGKRVWVALGSSVVACYDMDGKRQWIVRLDEATGGDGHSASPILAGGKLLVPMRYLHALDPATGAILWKNEEVEDGFGTPVAAEIEGTLVAVNPNGTVVRVADGKLMAKDIGSVHYASPIVSGNIVYFGDHTCTAVQLTKKGDDAFAAKELWSVELEGEPAMSAVYASSVVADGLLHVVRQDAEYYVFDAKTGQVVFKQALEIPPGGQGQADAGPMCLPSLILAGGRLYVSNDKGNSVVLTAGREYKPIKTSDLSDSSASTPAVAGKCIYIRGGDMLYCIGDK